MPPSPEKQRPHTREDTLELLAKADMTDVLQRMNGMVQIMENVIGGLGGSGTRNERQKYFDEDLADLEVEPIDFEDEIEADRGTEKSKRTSKKFSKEDEADRELKQIKRVRTGAADLIRITLKVVPNAVKWTDITALRTNYPLFKELCERMEKAGHLSQSFTKDAQVAKMLSKFKVVLKRCDLFFKNDKLPELKDLTIKDKLSIIRAVYKKYPTSGTKNAPSAVGSADLATETVIYMQDNYPDIDARKLKKYVKKMNTMNS